MKKGFVIAIFLILMFQVNALAQVQLKDKIYADLNIGAFFFDNAANGQLQAGLGYRINERHGVGLSFRREVGGNVYDFQGLKGLGIDYRYATDFGLIGKVGLGKVLDAWAAVDYHDAFVFKSSNLYTNLLVAYQIRFGFTFGLYFTYSPEMVFERYLPEWCVYPPIGTSDTLVYQGDSARPFVNYGVTIGYALPWKPKRN